VLVTADSDQQRMTIKSHRSLLAWGKWLPLFYPFYSKVSKETRKKPGF
jgi:hypothetical protein